jgi:AcrR family transcriptional regulator
VDVFDDGRPASDLTARARIRDAALVEFAAQGTRGATLRGIAARAKVSPALVQHHFKTKDGVRAACDEYVLDYIRSNADAGLGGGGEVVSALMQSSPPVLRYLARALVDGSPAAAELFDELVDVWEAFLRPMDGRADARARAVVFTAMRLGVTVLHEHVSRGLGTDLFGPESVVRVGRAVLDVLAHEPLPPETASAAEAALADFERTRSSTAKTEGTDNERTAR